MKKYLLAAVLTLIGCGSLNEQYVLADRDFIAAIDSEYTSFVLSGYQFADDGALIADVDSSPILLSPESIELRLANFRLHKQLNADALAAIDSGVK